MGEYTDRLFLHPRLLLSARQVEVWDAINLVLYAKLPVINVRRGRELVAGFVQRDELSAKALFTKSQTDRLVDKFGTEVASLRYPVGPSQYEPLLERLLENGEDVLPFFYHEHHLLVDRRRRAAAFTRVNRELLEEVRKGEVILQRSDSERIHWTAPDAWMTKKTLSAYLERQGVAPWWEIETNLASHARLERVLLSDTLHLSETLEGYDAQQVPSFVFAEMLLKRSRAPRGYATPVQMESETSAVRSNKEKPKPLDSLKLSEPPKATDKLGEGPVRDSQGTRPGTKELRPQNQGAESFFSERETRRDTSSKDEHGNAALPAGTEFPATTDQGMLSKKEVAKLIGMSVSSVDNLRKQPHFPVPISYGSTTLRWRRSDISRWLATR